MSGAYSGGPAFPCDSVSAGYGGREPQLFAGMSRRDYFAAHAPEVPGDFLRADVPCVRELFGGRKEPGTRFESTLEWTVRWRLHYADAMLKALKRSAAANSSPASSAPRPRRRSSRLRA